MDGQMTIFDFPELLPGQTGTEAEIRIPCNKQCDCEWGSLLCFEKRGYMYDRLHRQWCKDDSGKPLVRDTKECDWKPNNGYEQFHEHCRHRGWLKGETDTEPATWMCGFANKKLAKGWNDWIPCTVENCPLLK